MSYIGNTPTTQSFISGTDYFNGTGAQTAFTLSRTVASVNDIQAVVNNVVQVPNDAYTISGTTITFTSAPSSGTQNVYVRYLSTTTQAITPSQGTVGWSQLNSDTQQDLGINNKNRIINGNMVISQRGTSFSVDNDTIYSLDRWMVIDQTSGVFTAAQSSDAPTGFVNSLLATVTTADASIGATELALIRQRIEGLNCGDLGWGTANAKTVTLSFWVKSSLTGTFGGSIINGDASRSYPYSYTISTANTWEKKSVTIVGDTTGTWATTNTTFAQVDWSLAVGSTYSGTAGVWGTPLYLGVTGQVQVMSTLGATFYITGVMLEVGTQATTFTTAGGSYGAELALCQRYYEVINTAATTVVQYGGYFGIPYVTTSQAFGIGTFKVTKRSAPTVTFYDNTGTAGTVLQNGIAGGIGATADGINVSGFNVCNRTSGNFNGSANYPILAGFSAAAEL